MCALAKADWCPRELHVAGIGPVRALRVVRDAAAACREGGDPYEWVCGALGVSLTNAPQFRQVVAERQKESGASMALVCGH